jgi:hypothetical protein
MFYFVWYSVLFEHIKSDTRQIRGKYGVYMGILPPYPICNPPPIFPLHQNQKYAPTVGRENFYIKNQN